MSREFSRIAIVNRGEAAMRLLNAVRELNAEAGGDPPPGGGRYRTIALYTEPDAHAMFVREADEAFRLGPALVRDRETDQERPAYVDLALLESALVACRAEAVWPGWGFLAEDPRLAELCDRLGIVFIGPPADAMRRLSDKVSAKALARQLGLPVIPGSDGAVATVEDAMAVADRIGYPILLKPSNAGGGRGLRRVGSVAELAAAFPRAGAEAAKAFGSATLLVEKLLEGVRHVELQMMADAHGTVWAAGTRDCSLQRRYQKVLEEAPATDLPADVEADMKSAASRLLREAGYRNAGTVETLYEPATRAWYFLEVNTRLQVEHAVTELTTGLDLVKLQIAVAHGERLDGEPPPPSGHAIEVRLNAEDPDAQFAPAPGTFVLFRLPTGPGLRIDRGVTEGDRVPPQFDSMVAKLIAHGRTRNEAMARLARALAESAVLIDGGTTNKSSLLHLLHHAEVKAGPVDVAWLERDYRQEAVPHPNAAASLVMAILEIDATERARELKEFFVTASRLRPQVPEGVGRRVELRHRGQVYAADVFRRGPGESRVFLDGRFVDAQVDVLGRFERWLDLGGKRHRMLSFPQEPVYRVEADGIPLTFSRDDGGIVRASSPAVVVSVAVKPGDLVKVGDPIAVLEAMKMEMTVPSPFAGRVRDVFAIPNSQVGPGAPLCQLDAVVTRANGSPSPEAASGPRIALTRILEPAPDAASRCADLLDLAHHLVLGYDVDPATSRRLAEEYGRECGGLAPDDPGRLRAEDEILRVFCDVASLFRRTPADTEVEPETVSSSEYFLIYLRTLSADVSRLPAPFLDRLRRALAWYGVPDLTRTTKLEDALLCLYRSRQRSELSVPVVTAILERRLANVRDLAPFATEPHRHLLDRLRNAAERRHPIVADLVSELRFKLFDAPLFERRRQEVWAAAEESLNVLALDTASPEREARVRALVDCPETLKNVLAGRLETASPALRHLMLEVMTRRYYRIREILTFAFEEVGSRSVAHAQYELEGRRVHVLTTYGHRASLAGTARDLFPVLATVPEGHDVVVDLFLWDDDPPGDPDAEAAALAKVLEEAAFPRPLRRIVTLISGPAGRPTRHYTYRSPAPPAGTSGPPPVREDRFYRNLHPMVGKRFQLWRLLAFDIERLPSSEGVFLFRAVARDNPKDARLFAFGEVRDMTPVRDESGRVVELPHLTRNLTEALAAIRSQLARKKPEERPQWNQVLVNVWPPFTLTLTELNALAARLAPATAGLGIEKVSVLARMPPLSGGPPVDTLLELSNPGGTGLSVAWRKPDDAPIVTLSEYELKVAKMRQRGLPYPYEIVEMLTPAREGTRSDLPPGTFQELDVDPAGQLVPVSRPYGRNTANNVVGLITSYTAKHPEGMRRVILLGDPSREMGSVAEPECRRILGALDLAARLKVPLEWFAISAGAKISTESGTENMDWISKVLRRIVEFTQAGGEINVVVTGINVGAQPYWNAEATMLMHTRGILIMTADGAMVLTGKTALDYSGSVSAEDNHGIGGYDRVMGPNGQAQYFAPDIHAACQLLMRHYEHTYVAPLERFPRRAPTADPVSRDVCRFPHGGDLFETVGDVLGDEKNAGRKKPFDIRKVMLAVTDQDHPPLERWSGMRDAEIGVVWDAHIGGYPVCLLGLESRPLTRLGFVPADGPDHWTSGTLFPFSSKKIARAVTSASGNRPLVILANLSGFDGSPESMRKLQLEYGAEIGRAVVNFKGPIVFCVVSRYHGGAFVVFSKTLNDNMEAVALEGTYASVIGGAPAAAVVFAREVEARTRKDQRLASLEKDIAALPPESEAERRRLRVRLAELRTTVRSEKLGEVADEFDGVHSVQRALRVGSLDRIIPPQTLRPYLVSAIERGMARETARLSELVTA